MDSPNAKWRRLFAAIVLAASVAVIVVVPSLASPRAGGDELLPDLDQRVPSGVTTAANADGSGWDLNFDSAVENVGDGPLLLKGSRASTAVQTMAATQQVRTGTGAINENQNSGTLRYVRSPDHQHWHLDGFDRYELRKARTGELVGPDRKTGFCLGDRYDADPGNTLPNKPQNKVLQGQCERNNEDALQVISGISVGYGDEYKGGLEGQSIDVTGVPAGRYLLVHRVNADGKLDEKTADNNAASVLIQLNWPRGTDAKPEVSVLARCPDTATCEATPAAGSSGPATAAAVIASGLQTPWEVLPLPDGRVLVSELPGRVRVISPAGALEPAAVYTEPGARKFLGMAIDPGYAYNRFVYLYVTRSTAEGSRVVRLTDTGTALTNAETIYGDIASDGQHDGGRMAFGPDGKLYVTTGDIHDPALPQDKTSPNGKILRMNADGTAPADNPFAGQGGAAPWVWSYGHRHPQGIAWDSLGRMWESEHGPSGEAHAPAGAKTGNDEINRIEPGRDYGWPTVAGDQTAAGMTPPVAHAGAGAWAPGGLAMGADQKLYAPFLVGTELRAFATSGDGITGQTTHYDGTYGRMRTAVADGSRLWLTTSNNTSNEKVLCVLVAVGTACPVPGQASAGGSSAGSQPPPGSAAATAAPSSAGPGASTLPTARVTKALDALLARQVKALRRRSVAQLRATRRLTLRDRALPAKRLSIELSTRTAGGRRRLAYGGARTGPGRAVAIRMQLYRSPLGSLSARPRPRLVLTAALRTGDGRLISRASRFRPR